MLLDESLPRGLADHLPGHDVTTVPMRGWASKSDGERLRLASREFEVFLTADRRLEHQQVLSRFSIAVVVLVSRSNRLSDLLGPMPRTLALLPFLVPGRAVRIQADTR